MTVLKETLASDEYDSEKCLLSSASEPPALGVLFLNWISSLSMGSIRVLIFTDYQALPSISAFLQVAFTVTLNAVGVNLTLLSVVNIRLFVAISRILACISIVTEGLDLPVKIAP